MFWTILLIISIFAAVAIILVFVGTFLVHRWTVNRIVDKTQASDPVDGTDWLTYDSKGKQQAKSVDLTGLNFERCSEAEFEEKVRELREITSKKKAQ
jgi:LPS O-antigen subunit length determinant protein (WzzB/FepE family)